MLIVDSQIHIWTQGIPTNPAHRQISVYGQDDALREMDAAGVDAAVIHPPGWDLRPTRLLLRRPGSIPIALPSWAMFLSIVPRVGPWWRAGSSGQECSAVVLPSISRISAPGSRMARSTGCGRQPSALGCPSGWRRAIFYPLSARWPNVILGCDCSSIIWGVPLGQRCGGFCHPADATSAGKIS